MNRRQKIIVSVTGIFLVLLLLVGLTYAYFLTRINGNTNTKSISVSTANLALVYEDGNGIITGDKIQPGTTLDTKTFTVTNEGNATADYVVVIEDVSVTYAETIEVDDVTQTAGETTTFASNDFIYTLTCESDGAACDGINYETQFPINGNKTVLVGNSIEVGKTHTYSLTVTYKDTGIDQSADMNKKLEAKVNIMDINTLNPYSSDETLLAYNIINNAIGLTEQEKEAGYAELVSKPYTKVANQISETYASTGYVVPEDLTMEVSSTRQGYYWTYATAYSVDETTGKFSLTDAKTCKYNATGCIRDFINAGTDVYVVSTSASDNSSSSDTKKGTTNLTYIYKITEAPASSSSSINVKYRRVTNKPESVISATQDEYGTSYYYRGAVKNNYLSFNNMCWRIVRIEGDGAIKIVLADATASCSTATLAKTDSAYIGSGGYGYTKNSNSQYFADYENSANRTSSMKYKFNIFLTAGSFEHFDGTTKTYTAWSTEAKSKLKSTTACIGDTTTKYDDNGNIFTDSAAVEYGLWNHKNFVRLRINKYATLMCEGEKTSETKISPLTADEVVLAGGKVGASNYTYYLRENATTSDWWTLSPSYFVYAYGYDCAFVVNDLGVVDDYHTVNDNSGLRPAVSLVSGVKIANGDGSISNPYTIK